MQPICTTNVLFCFVVYELTFMLGIGRDCDDITTRQEGVLIFNVRTWLSRQNQIRTTLAMLVLTKKEQIDEITEHIPAMFVLTETGCI